MRIEQKFMLDLISFSLFNNNNINNNNNNINNNINEENFDIKYFSRIVVEQKMQGHVLDALTKLNLNNSPYFSQYYKSLYNDHLQNVIINTNQLYELSIIEQIFSQNNLFYVLLKGSFMKKYYSNPDNRTMGDIDILIDYKNRDFVQKILIQNNYTLSKKSDTHDVFTKGYVHLEVHHHLTRYGNKVSDFINDNLQNNIANNSLTNEFNLIYQLEHLSKHIKNGGAGFKSIIDIALFISNEKFDKQKLVDYLDKTSLTKLLLCILSITKKYLGFTYSFDFSYIPIEDMEQIIAYIFKTGEFGFGYDNDYYSEKIANQLSKQHAKTTIGKKISYIIKNICLPYKTFKTRSKIIKYCPILLPIGWIFRFFRILFTKPKLLKKELSSIKNINTVDINNVTIINKLGL